jgi:hypothetical protein
VNNKKKISAVSAAFLFCSTVLAQTPASPPAEDPTDVLKRQLSAQQGINQQLKQRVEALERELALQRNTSFPVIVGLDTSAPPPQEIMDVNRPISAIEEALGEKGLVLLPVGAYRITPSISWSHNTQGTFELNSYALNTSIEAGLPMGMAVSLLQPYVWRNDSDGTNSGRGDFSVGFAKKLNNETSTIPSFVARLGYTHDSGKDSFTSKAIGFGFRSYNFGVSAVKRFDPLVMYGSISHDRVKSRDVVLSIIVEGTPLLTHAIKPGATNSVSWGVTLAATPEISLDAGLSLSFSEKTRYMLSSGGVLEGKRSTTGYLNLGMGYLLTRNLSLVVGASAGITKNASDFGLSVALPFRF